MRRPWLPLNVSDYLLKTTHLSTVQHGVLSLLMLHYWITGGLPDDDQQLANIARLPLDEWKQHRPTIQALFVDGWRYEQLDAEMRRIKDIGDKRARAGSKGGTVTFMKWHRKPK